MWGKCFFPLPLLSLSFLSFLFYFYCMYDFIFEEASADLFTGPLLFFVFVSVGYGFQ